MAAINSASASPTEILAVSILWLLSALYKAAPSNSASSVVVMPSPEPIANIAFTLPAS